MITIPRIIEGDFALVGAGNTTRRWILDGDDVQARANAALDGYYGSHALVYQRGVHGWAIHAEGEYMAELYDSQETAMSRYARILLPLVGRALYGERWQTDLAHALKLSDARRIRQWLAGDRKIPDGVWSDLRALLRRRGMSALELYAEIGEINIGEIMSIDRPSRPTAEFETFRYGGPNEYHEGLVITPELQAWAAAALPILEKKFAERGQRAHTESFLLTRSLGHKINLVRNLSKGIRTDNQDGWITPADWQAILEDIYPHAR